MSSSTILENCAICLSEISTDLYETECGHTFHNACIQDWVNSGPNKKCPLCRGAIRQSDEADDEADDDFVLQNWTAEQRPRRSLGLTIIDADSDDSDAVAYPFNFEIYDSDDDST